jgi:hypothetical protein
MANIKLIFQDSSEKKELQCYATISKQILIEIKNDFNEFEFICLDKITAVRLVRELKKQIGLLESEVSNG